MRIAQVLRAIEKLERDKQFYKRLYHSALKENKDTEELLEFYRRFIRNYIDVG